MELASAHLLSFLLPSSLMLTSALTKKCHSAITFGNVTFFLIFWMFKVEIVIAPLFAKIKKNM